MPSNLPQFTIRINLERLAKLRYIANVHSCSANREVEILITKHIADFEHKYGEIDTNWIHKKEL